MRKQTIRQTKILDRNGIHWYTFDEVFKKFEKSQTFRKAYAEEMARLKLARQIRDIRTKKKMTQKAVAIKAGMPQSVIARIETGDRGITVDTLGRVAHAFGKEVQLV